MSYTNYINKLSSETKKVIEEHNTLHEELKKQNLILNLLQNYNDNSIGYKIKYTFHVENEFTNNFSLIALEILINYVLEHHIQKNDMSFFHYSFNINDNHLILSLFHSRKDYLATISENLGNIIINGIQNISAKIRPKFVDISSTPFTFKVKILQKQYPILVDILCNKISQNNLNNDIENIVDSLIKLIIINEINLVNKTEILNTTFKSEENSYNFLIENSKKPKVEIKMPETKKAKIEKPLENKENTNENVQIKKEEILKPDMEIVNDNIKQLFWHTLDSMEEEKPKSKWFHSLIFVLIVALTLYSVPKYIQKFINFSKNKSVIDNILDLATEDLTTFTKTLLPTSNFKNNNKLDTIVENSDVNGGSPFEPFEPAQPSEPSDNDIKVITRNIIKSFSTTDKKNLDLKSIENRLKLILEETDTKT